MLEVGMEVSHAKYGIGKIVAVLYPYKKPIVVVYTDGTKQVHAPEELTHD